MQATLESNIAIVRIFLTLSGSFGWFLYEKKMILDVDVNGIHLLFVSLVVLFLSLMAVATGVYWIWIYNIYYAIDNVEFPISESKFIAYFLLSWHCFYLEAIGMLVRLER